MIQRSYRTVLILLALAMLAATATAENPVFLTGNIGIRSRRPDYLTRSSHGQSSQCPE